MTDPYRRTFSSALGVLAADGAVTPQAYTVRALSLLEAEFRALALLALADWEKLELVEPELFASIGGLQRPSWGSWNFLLQSLRSARKVQLRGGRAAVREAIDGARTLGTILTSLDTASSADVVDAARPVSELIGGKQSLKRVGDVLSLPIALRNRVAHFPPTDEAGWSEIRTALGPLVAWHAEHPNTILAENARWPEPWFLTVDGDVWAFNGAEKDFAVSYASPTSSRPRPVPERAGAFVQALQRLLGKTDVQEQSFHRLLARLAPEDIRGVVLGDFLVGAPVGKGGFATVHVGRQLSTGRKVAIKILHDGLSDDSRLRFQQEAAFLSRINHSGVVGVVSYGEDAWSVPRFVDLKSEEWFQQLSRGAAIKTYIALEWIDGQTLEDLFQKVHVEKGVERPALVVLRGWFRQSAEALAAAHKSGLIHRDIKPANLMITSDDQTIRLMDFGVARSDDENRTLMTSTGYALGTPPYMSPEQIRARDADAEVGPATDIYSLCATFYELSTGTRLFGHDKESLEAVKTQKLRGELPTRPRQLVKSLPWELETILVGGLTSETADRYRTAEGLARDIAHWERDEPLEYRRPGLLRRAQLAYRRSRTVTNIVAVALLLAIAGVVFYVHTVRAASARTEAQRALAEQESSRADQQRERAEKSLGGLLVEKGRTELFAGRPLPAAVYLSEAYRLGASDSPSRYLLAQAMRPVDALQVSLEGHHGAVTLAAFSPDGTRIVTASLDQTAKLWDGHTGTLLVTLEGHHGAVNSAVFSPDGARVATASWDHTAKVWDSHTGALLATLEGHHAAVNSAAFSPDGTRVVTASMDGTAKLWDSHTGTLLASLEGHHGAVNSAVFGPDGTRVVTASADGTAKLWDGHSGTLLASLEGHHGAVKSTAFSPDGTRVVTASADGTAKLWDGHSGTLLASLEDQAGVTSAVFSPDGARVVTASIDHTAKLWDGHTGTLLASLDGHQGHVASAAFSPDGARVVTASWDHTAKLWDGHVGTLLASLEGHQGEVESAVFSPDGTRVVTASVDGTAKLWDGHAGRLLASLEGHQGFIRAIVFGPDGTRVVTASDDHTAKLWDGHTGRLLASLECQGAVRSAAFSPDGTRVVTASDDHTAKLWDSHTGTLLASLEGQGAVNSATFSPDGTRVVTASDDHTAKLWNGHTGALLASLEGHQARVTSAAFSPDGARVVTASDDHTAKLWDGHTGMLLASLKGHRGVLTSAVFSPDGMRIVTASSDGTAKLWDGNTGTRLASLDGHHGGVTSAVFSPDSARVVTASSDGTAKLWDGHTGKLMASLNGHQGLVTSAVFSPDGTRVVTASLDHTAKLWDGYTGTLLASLEEHQDQDIVQSAVFSPDGTRVVTASGNDARLWDVHLEMRSPEEIARIVATKVPLQYVDGQVLPKPQD